MKRLIAVLAAMSFAALASPALAGENTESSLPDVSQIDQASADAVVGEEMESAATGDSAPSDGESAGAESDYEYPAEIDQ